MSFNFRLSNSNVGSMGNALIMFYFVSINKPEFDDFAEKLSTKSKSRLVTNRWFVNSRCEFLSDCYTAAWCTMVEDDFERDFLQTKTVATFLREHCTRNDLNLTEWLKTQSKVRNNFKRHGVTVTQNV